MKMDKYYIQALKLLAQTQEHLDWLASHNERESALLDDINTLFTHLREQPGSPFDKYMMMKHGEDYTWLDDDMPDRYQDWLAEKSAEELQEYFDDFISSL